MIDHTGISVSDFQASKAFYARALAAIGYELLAEIPASVTGRTDVAGFGERPKPDFWISKGTPNQPALHVAFRAESRAQVDAFYKAAIAAGGATCWNASRHRGRTPEGQGLAQQYALLHHAAVPSKIKRKSGVLRRQC